jgi:hypothetical protein
MRSCGDSVTSMDGCITDVTKGWVVVTAAADGEGYIRNISSGGCHAFPTARTYAHVHAACFIAQAHPDSLLLT